MAGLEIVMAQTKGMEQFLDRDRLVAVKHVWQTIDMLRETGTETAPALLAQLTITAFHRFYRDPKAAAVLMPTFHMAGIDIGHEPRLEQDHPLLQVLQHWLGRTTLGAAAVLVAVARHKMKDVVLAKHLDDAFQHIYASSLPDPPAPKDRRSPASRFRDTITKEIRQLAATTWATLDTPDQALSLVAAVAVQANWHSLKIAVGNVAPPPGAPTANEIARALGWDIGATAAWAVALLVQASLGAAAKSVMDQAITEMPDVYGSKTANGESMQNTSVIRVAQAHLHRVAVAENLPWTERVKIQVTKARADLVAALAQVVARMDRWAVRNDGDSVLIVTPTKRHIVIKIDWDLADEQHTITVTFGTKGKTTQEMIYRNAQLGMPMNQWAKGIWLNVKRYLKLPSSDSDWNTWAESGG